MTLDELKAIYAAMTPGEWRACNHNWDFQGYKVNSSFTIAFPVPPAGHKFDKDGIVALHNAFPAIVERLERAEAFLRLFADHRDCHEIRAFLAESDKPLGGGSA